MTNREFLTAVSTSNITDEIKEYAINAITKMDEANAKKKNKPSKATVENAPYLDRIVTEILSAENVTAGEVAEILGVSTQKASSLLRQVVASGAAVSEDIKVKGKSTCKGYRLAD